MKLLDRYLLGQFGRNLLLIGSSLIAVYLLVDFFERIDNFLAAGKPFSLAVQYFLLKIPQILDQMMPVCVLLAGITTLGLLNRHHELVALKAAGISVSRIVAPLLAGALLVTGLSLAAGQWLLPPTVTATNRIYYRNVQHRIPTGIIRDGRIYHHARQGIYSFLRPDPAKSHFVDFSYARWDKAYRLELLLTARTADWQQGRWRFTDGQTKRLHANGEYVVELFQSSNQPLPEAPDTFFVPEYKVTEYSLSQLYAQARATTAEERRPLIDFHRRLSYLFLGLPLLLLGIPVLLAVQAHRGRDLALAIPVSCGLAFGAWGWWSMAQSLARSSALHPALLSWSIHIVAASLGLYFIRRQDR